MKIHSPLIIGIIGTIAGIASGVELGVAKAQAAGPDVFMELWKYAQTGTPFVVLILLAGIYYINAERKAVQTRYDTLFEKYVVLGTETNSTLKEFRDLFSRFVNVRSARGRGGE